VRNSLDNRVGELLEVQRHIEVDRLGCIEIDDKFEFGLRLHWKLDSLSSQPISTLSRRNRCGCCARAHQQPCDNPAAKRAD
jgi:hypothetical protein